MEKYQVEEEISLKELIVILLKNWKLIFCIMTIGISLAVVFNYFIAKPIYETEVELFMNFPESKVTEIGNYRYPSNNAQDYFELVRNLDLVNRTIIDTELKMSHEDFVNNLSIYQEKDSNVISVKLRGSDPDVISKALDNHIDNYKKYLSFQFREDAINQFISEDKVLLSLKQNEFAKNKELLNNAKNKMEKLSPTIPLQKALTSSPEIAAQYARDNGLTVAELSNQLLVEEIVNSNYISAENLVDNLEMTIGTLEIEIAAIKDQLEVLGQEHEILMNSNVFDIPKNDFLSVLSLPIRQVAPANIPADKASPNNFLNVTISAVISILIGVFIVFFQTYWKNN